MSKKRQASTLFGLVMFLLASRFWKRYTEYRGAIFLFYWSAYGVGRFLLEYLRGNAPRHTPLGLALSQLVIIVVVYTAAVGCRVLLRTGRTRTTACPPAGAGPRARRWTCPPGT